MFVLVTSRPDVLLPTVRSRCQRLRFGPLSPADVAAVLMRDHEYAEARRARGRVAVGRQHRPRARGRRRRARRGARARPQRCSKRWRGVDDPRRRLDGAQGADWSRARRQRSRRAGAPAARAGVAAARPRCPAFPRGRALRWPMPTCGRCSSGCRGRSTASARFARFQRSTARWRRSSATPARRSSPTGWCCRSERARSTSS